MNAFNHVNYESQRIYICTERGVVRLSGRGVDPFYFAVVDEFIVNVGRCDDGTIELIRSIGDPRIKIV